MMNGKHTGCYSYREFGSKNLQGVLQNKVVQQQENEINPQMCHAKILYKYFDGLSKSKACIKFNSVT